MAQFIDGVNRLLRINSVIKGDDDNITTFADNQHAADIELAQIAIQDELGEVVSERLIGHEKASDNVTLVTGTRTYNLAADFVRFFGTFASFFDAVDNVRIYEYEFGEDRLRDFDLSYKATQGAPTYWYWSEATTKQVAFYSVPDTTHNGRSLAYDYEKSVLVTNATDTLPFATEEEYQAFISMASRRFRFMLTEQDLGLLTKDPTYNNAKARLANFLRPTNPRHRYGRSYR